MNRWRPRDKNPSLFTPCPMLGFLLHSLKFISAFQKALILLTFCFSRSTCWGNWRDSVSHFTDNTSEHLLGTVCRLQAKRFACTVWGWSYYYAHYTDEKKMKARRDWVACQDPKAKTSGSQGLKRSTSSTEVPPFTSCTLSLVGSAHKVLT